MLTHRKNMYVSSVTPQSVFSQRAMYFPGQNLCLAVVFLCAALAACTPARQPVPDVRQYTLEYPSPVLTGPRAKAVLHVARFGAAPEYRTTKLIYRDQSFVRQEYTYHQWRATPQILASDFIRRDLHASGLFTAVNPPSSMIPATHEIEGMVEQWLEEDRPEHWLATLELTITLVDVRAPASPDMILFQRTYQHSQPCAQKNPVAVVEAMSQAMEILSARIIADVHADILHASQKP